MSIENIDNTIHKANKKLCIVLGPFDWFLYERNIVR